MPDYRRYRVAGGTYFFTVKMQNNAPVFGELSAVRILGNLIRTTQERWPFEIPAIVCLPDHLHTIWQLPSSDADYSIRWAWLKKEFTKRYLHDGGAEQPISPSRVRNRRRGVWQRRFWEHTIMDEADFSAHFDYVHWNPVKHGYVDSPRHWPHSSFHRHVKSGVYDINWGRSIPPASITNLSHTGE